MPSENCSYFGTDNVRRQISKHIFMPNGGYNVYSGLLVGCKKKIAGFSGTNSRKKWMISQEFCGNF